MRMYDLIEKKKRGFPLTNEEIYEMIALYTKGEIPDYQMSALTMAIYFKGMTDEETFCLTDAMAKSGDTVSLEQFGDRSVDKHSTGGVGDKTTLIVAPLVASAGGIVAKMSGRGLGHTGGTVDKLESFPGFRTSLAPDEFTRQVEEHGIAVIGQSADLAPADKKLYALRDVTATVDSLPLIASSIMSKKLAAGTRSIVLDVKCGSGAFMRTPEAATELAKTMVRIGSAHGRNMAAVITNMDIPLGHAIGNAMEVREAIEVLRGKGPDDLREVCLTLASRMIALSCKITVEDARKIAEEHLSNGKAYHTFCQWIEAQGGDGAYAQNPDLFGIAPYTRNILAPGDGYIVSCNAEMIGTAAMMLGAGRQTTESVIDPRAGIYLHKKTGDAVKAGEVIATLYTEREDTLSASAECASSALTYSADPICKQPLIFAIIDSASASI